MRRRAVFLFVAWMICLPCLCFAHSTAGLVQVTLEKNTIGVDDVAFYLERAVGKRVDEDGFKNRFYLLSFDRISQSKNPVEIHVTISDQKTGAQHKEVLLLNHNQDGTWDHVLENGDVVEAAIYTYVPPVNWMYWGGVCLLGVLAFGGLILLVVRRRTIFSDRQTG